MIFRKTIFFLGVLSLITACYSNPIHNKASNSQNQTPPPTNTLVDFCKQNGGQFDLIQGVATCISNTSVCTSIQYAQDQCVNFNQCVNKPAQCDPRTHPHAPSYCRNGDIITIRDACGCVTGSLCKTN